MLHQHIEQWFILSLRSDNHHIIVIFCSSTNQRDSTYIDFLNDSRLISTRCHGCFKWIKIYNHEIYFRDFILLNLLNILFQSTTTKDTSEDFRMQCLHTAT